MIGGMRCLPLSGVEGLVELVRLTAGEKNWISPALRVR